MSRQDRYIPGVPCWVDSTQPDPDAAVTFYGGLFAWDFDDVMPPDAPGTYFVARLPGGDVAAIGSQPEGAPDSAVWNTYVWTEDADETAAKVRASRGHRPDGAGRRRGVGTHGDLRRPRRRRATATCSKRAPPGCGRTWSA